jgi:hypothetical protein
MPQAETRARIGVSHTAEHRDGHCSTCGTMLDKGEVGKMPLRYCPNCKDYRTGKLIAKEHTIAPPDYRACLKITCLGQYCRDLLTFALISIYDARRFSYAVNNRHRKMPMRYRNGEPLPGTLLQSLWENIIISLPVIRDRRS